jgi:hypothetical protein
MAGKRLASDVLASIRVIMITGAASHMEVCRKDWTDPRMQKVVADLSADGYSAGTIAYKLGLTKGQVASAMQYYGLYARPRGPRRAQPKVTNAA